MSKKFKTFPFVLISLVLSGCNYGETHEHTFDLDHWEKNQVSHWHKATCEHTDLIKDMGEHVFGDDNVCDLCGYVLTQQVNHVVSFNSNGGTQVSPIAVNDGGSIAEPQEPTKANFTFLGWYESDDYTGNPYVFGSSVNNDITLHALWGISVKFIGYNNEVYKEEKLRLNTKVTKPADPVLSGFHFDNWYTNSDFSGEPFNFDQPINSEMNLYGKFGHKVIFLNDSFEVYKTEILTESEPVLEPVIPEKIGHNFLGWYTDTTFNTSFTFGGLITNDLVLYCKMNPITYSITYENAEGLSHENPNSYVYGTNLEIKAPTADAYEDTSKFYGWYFDEEFTQPATEISNTTLGDITLYAKRGTYHNITYKNWPTGISNSNPTRFTKYDQIELTREDFADYEGFYAIGFMVDGDLKSTIPYGVDKDIEVTVLTDRAKSSVTLNPNGGEMIPLNPCFYIELKQSTIKIDLPGDGTPIDIYEATKGKIPEEEGYLFAGFYKDCSFSEPLVSGEENLIENGSTIYAKYISVDEPDSTPSTMPFVYKKHYSMDGFEGATNLNIFVPNYVDKVNLSIKTNGNGHHLLSVMSNPNLVIIDEVSINSNEFIYTKDEIDLSEAEHLIIAYEFNGDYDIDIESQVVSFKETLVKCSPTAESGTYDVYYWDIPSFSDVYLDRYTFKGWYDYSGNKVDTENLWLNIEGNYVFTAKLLPSGDYIDQLIEYGNYVKAFITDDTKLSADMQDYNDIIVETASALIVDANSIDEMQSIVNDKKIEMENTFRSILTSKFIQIGLAYTNLVVGDEDKINQLMNEIDLGSNALDNADIIDLYAVYKAHLGTLSSIYEGKSL